MTGLEVYKGVGGKEGIL